MIEECLLAVEAECGVPFEMFVRTGKVRIPRFRNRAVSLPCSASIQYSTRSKVSVHAKSWNVEKPSRRTGAITFAKRDMNTSDRLPRVAWQTPPLAFARPSLSSATARDRSRIHVTHDRQIPSGLTMSQEALRKGRKVLGYAFVFRRSQKIGYLVRKLR